MRTPIIADILGENRLPLVEVTCTHMVRIIPAMPEFAGLELFGLEAKVLLFLLADSEGTVAIKLRIPLGQANLPRHLGAAEGAFALVPAAVHRPVPGKRHAIFDWKERLDSLGGPVLNPIGNLLNGNKVQIEIAGMHRTQVSRRVMIDDSGRIE